MLINISIMYKLGTGNTLCEGKQPLAEQSHFREKYNVKIYFRTSRNEKKRWLLNVSCGVSDSVSVDVIITTVISTLTESSVVLSLLQALPFE